MRLALLVVASITLAGTAHARGGILIPPLEFDYGVGFPLGEARTNGLSPSTELLAGLHWASLAWKPTRLDFGVGYVRSFRMIDDPIGDDDQAITMNGVYLALGTTVVRLKRWRTWFTGRGELMRVDDNRRDFSAAGVALRVATEWYNPTLSNEHDGFIVGTFALGIFLEASYRDVPAAYGSYAVSSGVTLRLPFALGST
jgi:hypothetical protein